MKSSDGSRILNGSALMVGGVFKTVGGTILTAASIPATSEVIGVAGIGAGTVTAFSGKSDLQQGYEEIRLGIKGDTSTETVNEMCARLYDGNATIYHESTGIAAAMGTMLLPYVQAQYGRGTMTVKPGTVAENAARDTRDRRDIILEENRIRGREFEQQEFVKFNAKYNNAQEQITVVTASGRRTRLDAIGLDENGNIVIYEFKSSKTAPVTSNQTAAFQEILDEGATVVGNGKGIFTQDYHIPAGIKVEVIRPE